MKNPQHKKRHYIKRRPYVRTDAQRIYHNEHPTCELVCINFAMKTPHHIKTQGSGGKDNEENLLSLCAGHHADIHILPLEKFMIKYKVRHPKLLKRYEERYGGRS